MTLLKARGTDRAFNRWRLIVGTAVGVLVLLAVSVMALVTFTDAQPALRMLRTSSERLAAQDPRCAGGVDQTDGADLWERNWALRGNMSVEQTAQGALPLGSDRQLVLWETADQIDVTVPDSLGGGWDSGDGSVLLFALADSEVPFGFSFDVAGAKGSFLCGLSITLPLEGANITYRFEPKVRLGWLTLRQGESVVSETRSGESLSIARLAESVWEFVIDGSGEAGLYVRQVRLRMEVDGSSPPWNTLRLQLNFDTLRHRASAELQADRPTCLQPDGQHQLCPR